MLSCFQWGKVHEYIQDDPFIEFLAVMNCILRKFQSAVRPWVALRICSQRIESMKNSVVETLNQDYTDRSMDRYRYTSNLMKLDLNSTYSYN
jgi:hypothetical protein